MTETEFRKSEKYREGLRSFLQTDVGREFSNILYRKCLPVPLNVAGKMSSEDQIRAMGLVAIHQQGSIKAYEVVMRMAEPAEGNGASVTDDFDYLLEPLKAHYADLEKRMNPDLK